MPIIGPHTALASKSGRDVLTEAMWPGSISIDVPMSRFFCLKLVRFSAPPQISVLRLPCLDVPEMTTSRQGT